MSANSPSAVPEAGSPVAEPTASSTPTLAVPTASSFVPKTPKMGGLVQTGSTDYCAWTGGKPKPDWSGLDSSAATEPLDAFQFRPSSPGSAQKSMKYREQGFETKFTMKSNLQVFIQEIQEYLARAGLDTISYLVDPANPSEMVSVVDNYSKFDLTTAIATAKSLRKEHFDLYDKTNDDSARRWFLDCLDPELAKKIKDRTDPNAGFIAYWLTFIHCFQSSSHAKFDNLKRDLENIRITKYAHQNVQDMATDFLRIGTELTNHHMY